MKKVICIVLLLALLLCGCTAQTADPTAEPTAAPTQAEVPPETEAPTQEPTMSEEEAQAILQERRDIVEAEMRHMMSVLWVSDVEASNKYRTLKAGRIYSGIPYTHGSGSGDSYLACGEPDENGVYHITGLNSTIITGNSGTSYNHCARLGNDCADAVFWAWGRVSSTISFNGTRTMAPAMGCIKVGDYVCDDKVSYKNTVITCQENGEDVMFAAYMQMQKGDAFTNYNGSTGHAFMFVDIHVEYTADGKIDAENSYALVHEQGGGGDQDGKTYFDETLGETVYRICSTDNKYTFRKLFDNGYLPVTIKELVDPSPLEEPWVEDSLEVRTIDDMYTGQITSNYRISHVTIEITGADGKLLQSSTCYARQDDKYTFPMKNYRIDALMDVLRGQLDLEALPAGTYTYTIKCHVATGDTLVAQQFNFSK